MVPRCSQQDFRKQGMRPGLLLKSITTADGFTRPMTRDDHSYIQISQQLTVAKRPFVCTFEPKAVPMEFTLDDSSHDKTVPSPSSSDPDSQYARYKWDPWPAWATLFVASHGCLTRMLHTVQTLP